MRMLSTKSSVTVLLQMFYNNNAMPTKAFPLYGTLSSVYNFESVQTELEICGNLAEVNRS